MWIETWLDYEPDDQPNRRNRRVHTDAEHVQPRNMCQHAWKLPLFVRQWIRLRRQLSSMHRCDRITSLRWLSVSLIWKFFFFRRQRMSANTSSVPGNRSVRQHTGFV